MRLARAGLALAALVLAVTAVPAAATPVSGTIERGIAQDVVRVTMKNDGAAYDEVLRLELPPGIGIVGVTKVAGVPGQCPPPPAGSNSVTCLFDPPGWPPGQTVVLDIQTSPRLPENAGAKAYSCTVGCPGGMQGPYAVSGPTDTFADLSISLSSFGSEDDAVPESDADPDDPDYEPPTYDVSKGPRGTWWVVLGSTVSNDGMDTATDVRVSLAPTAAPDGTTTYGASEVALGPRLLPSCRSAGGPQPQGALCDYDVFPSQRYSSLRYALEFRRAGEFRVHASVVSSVRDPQPLNNTATYSDTLRALPESEGGRWILGSSQLTGRVQNAAQVFVGVASESGGARLSDPPAEGSGAAPRDPAARSAAAACKWLTSKRVRFRRERGRRCDAPTYLRAKVTRGRWKIKLRKRLPAGRYVMITQAVSRDGVVESAVGPKIGNLKRFRVKRR